MLSDTTDVLKGNIIVGNHDSITLLGLRAQTELSDFSLKISKILIKANRKPDFTIDEILSEINEFEENYERENIRKIFYSEKRHFKDITERYIKLSEHIENITLFFRLQQAQLIKDAKVFELMTDKIQKTSEELKNAIDKGSEVLCRSPEYTGTDNKEWFDRLEKRIADLQISHTITLQNIAQMNILYKNNMLLIDKLSSVISNVLPLWRNRTAIILGLELMEQKSDIQERVQKITDRHIEKTVKRLKHSITEDDIKKLSDLNTELTDILSSIDNIERDDREFRDKLQKSL